MVIAQKSLRCMRGLVKISNRYASGDREREAREN